MIYLDKMNVGGTIQSVINVGGNIEKPRTVYAKELCFNEYREFPAVGEDGFLYVATDENAVYRFDKENYCYVCVSSAGATGSQGLKGDIGPQGLPGADGAKGDKGDTGPQGPKGDKGDTGTSGITVNNTLTSASTTEALSAAQGKYLNENKLSTKGGTLNGLTSFRPTTENDYNSGIRMHRANDGWSTVIFGISQSDGDTGSPTGGWLLYRRGNNFFGGSVGDAGIAYSTPSINSGLNLPYNGNNPTWFGKQLATYEQGTWTPKFTSGTGTGSGRYTRIGNRVFFNGCFSGQPKGTGAVAVTGLPFIPDTAGMYEFFATVVTNTAFPVFGGISADGSVGFGINGRVNYALTYADIDWTDMHLRFQGMFCTA